MRREAENAAAGRGAARPGSRRGRRAVALAALAAALVALLPRPATAAAEPAMVRPFVARFAVSWKGLGAATMTLELRETSPGRFTYTSTSVARGLMRAVYAQEATQVSRLEFVDGRVRPLEFRANDGTGAADKTIAIQFDWAAGRATGTAETRPVDLALKPGVQDAMSSQVALIAELVAGRDPSGFTLVDEDQLKEYVYVTEGPQRIETVAGTLDTVVYVSRRRGSERLTRVWYAKELGFVPVRAERIRKGKPELSMRLLELRR